MASIPISPLMMRSTASLRLVGRIDLPRDALNLRNFLRDHLLVRVVVLDELQEALGGRNAQPPRKQHNILNVIRPESEKFHCQQVLGVAVSTRSPNWPSE